MSEAPTLLRVTSHNRGFILPSRGNNSKLASLRKNCQVVDGAHGRNTSICPSKGDKVTSPGRLHGRVDRHVAPPTQIQAECWTMYFDGSLMKTGAGAGVLFISPLGVHMRYAIRLHFTASNNMAEYEALINGLHIVVELGVK